MRTTWWNYTTSIDSTSAPWGRSSVATQCTQRGRSHAGIRPDWLQPAAKKAAAIDEDVRKMANAVDPESTMGLRDRALLLFGFAGAFRRSKLVAPNTWNLDEREEGLKVTIEKS